MLEGEFNKYLGYHKQQKIRTDNVRKVTSEKTIRTCFLEGGTQVLRDCDVSFNFKVGL